MILLSVTNEVTQNIVPVLFVRSDSRSFRMWLVVNLKRMLVGLLGVLTAIHALHFACDDLPSSKNLSVAAGAIGAGIIILTQ